jgi:hypothetical protein
MWRDQFVPACASPKLEERRAKARGSCGRGWARFRPRGLAVELQTRARELDVDFTSQKCSHQHRTLARPGHSMSLRCRYWPDTGCRLTPGLRGCASLVQVRGRMTALRPRRGGARRKAGRYAKQDSRPCRMMHAQALLDGWCRKKVIHETRGVRDETNSRALGQAGPCHQEAHQPGIVANRCLRLTGSMFVR